MGIRSLNKWLSWICPTEFQERSVDWSTFRGATIGVDALGFLYRAKSTHMSMSVLLVRHLLEWKRHGVTPIFVFDGRTPQEKTSTCSARKKQRDRLPEEEQTTVTTADRNGIKQLIYAAGYMCLNAEGEADPVLAHMARAGILAAVVSSDMDYLPRGVPRLLVPSSHGDRWRDIRLEAVLASAQLTYPAFVDMCVLLGCDYCPSIPTLSYQTAYWLVRYKTDQTMLDILQQQGIRNNQMWVAARRLLLGQEDRWETLLSERQREKWAAGPTGIETEALEGLWRSDGGLTTTYTDSELHLLMSTSSVESCGGGAGDIGGEGGGDAGGEDKRDDVCLPGAVDVY